jgi:hypothetical protein
MKIKNMTDIETKEDKKPDLKELESRLDDCLSKETKESLTAFLNQQREKTVSSGRTK